MKDNFVFNLFRLTDTVRKIFNDLLKFSARMQLGNCVMPTRCISPNELGGYHNFYFDATDVNVSEKRKWGRSL